MMLPRYRSGEVIVGEERWHGLLWSAVPQRVVCSSEQELITHIPDGTVAVHATNRVLRVAAGLTRDERKLLALKTRHAVAGESREAPEKLHVYRPGRWARINLGWYPDGAFMGWYVNFELPPRPSPAGLVSKDLVLDIHVRPDRSWVWKDREDFETAITDGILDPDLRDTLADEAELVLAEVAQQRGPFRPELIDFRGDPELPLPELPTEYAWGGGVWTLPTGPRIDHHS